MAEAAPATFESLEPRVLLSTTPVAADDSFTAYHNQTLVVATEGASRLHMVSESGDYIGGGRTHDYTHLTGNFGASGGLLSGVTISYSSSFNSWRVSLDPIAGEPLLVGHYDEALRYPFNGLNNPGLSVSGDGRGCNTLTGNFTVHEAVYDLDGRIVRLLADFEQHCEGGPAALLGTIDYSAPPSSPGTVLANDAAASTRSVQLIAGVEHGSLTLNNDGTFRYTPAAGYLGTDQFTYQAIISGVASNVATVSINVVQAPPIIQDATVTLDEDTPVIGLVPASDPEGTPLNFRLLSEPEHGQLTFAADGTYTYTPDANYSGRDYFRVVANDGVADSRPATVVFEVASVEEPPAIQNDFYRIAHDQTLAVHAAGFNRLVMVSTPGDWIGLGRTYDLNDTTGRLLASGGLGGSLVQVNYNGSGSSDYWQVSMDAPGSEPLTEAYYPGTTRYPFNSGAGLSVTGQHRGCNTSTGEFTIHQLDYSADGAIEHLVADFEQHCEGGSSYIRGTVEFNATANPEAGVLGNDAEHDGQHMTAQLLSGPGHGTLTFNADGTFTYQPAAGFIGVDSFTYQAFDGVSLSSPATVTISVDNNAPVADDQAERVDEDGDITAALAVSDPDGDAVNFTLTTAPQHGTVDILGDGTFVYRPNRDFHGSDSFSYAASDGDLADSATVDLIISPVNDAPVAAGETFRIRQAGTVTLPAPGLLGNDSDVDGDALSTSIQTGPVGGAVLVNADGSMTYTAHAGFVGTDTFTYLVSDGGLQVPATVSIEVVPFLSPIALTAAVQGSNVTLNWSDNTGGFAESFQIERSAKPKGKNGVPSWTLIGTSSSTSFTDSSVPGGSWLYRVRAVADNIESAYSETVELRIAGSKGGGGKKNRNARLSQDYELLTIDSLSASSTKQTKQANQDGVYVIDLLSIVKV